MNDREISGMIQIMAARRLHTFNSERLKAARIELGWPQGRLAQRVGRSIGSVFAWESGTRTPGPETLVKLAATLGISAGELLTVPRDEYTLADLRTASGLTQRTAARKVGVTLPHYGHIELGYADVDPEVLPKLAALYGTTGHEVLACWTRGASAAIAAPDRDGDV